MAELLELAYALQIPYSPENPNLDFIKQSIDQLRIDAQQKDRKAWRRALKTERKSQRTIVCQEELTLMTRKNINLMAEWQLVYLPVRLKERTLYYPLDAVTDVDALLLLKKNPFTNEALISDQLTFLEDAKANHKYPRIVVGDFFEELDKRFGKKIVYQEKAYEAKMHQLSKLVENVGMHFESSQIFNFATEYVLTHYNLFLKHQPLSQKLSPCSRDSASALTLNHILNYLNIEYQRDKQRGTVATVHMAQAIDEFIYMIRNSLTYDELLAERGLAGELHWKPNFVMETHYPNGNLESQYYVNESHQRQGVYRYFYSNGTLCYSSTFVNGMEQDIVWYYGTGEKFKEGHTYWYPDGTVLAEPYNGVYRLYDESGAFLDYGFLEKSNNIVFRTTRNVSIKLELENKQIITLNRSVSQQKCGLALKWYLSGDLGLRLYYVEGQKEGLCEEWHRNGKLSTSEWYHKGQKHGLHTTYYANGTLKMHGDYENDKKVGFCTGYHSNGQKESLVFWDEGQKLGLAQIWHDNGILSRESSFKGDQRYGISQQWHENGQLLLYRNWDSGVHYQWYANGTLEFEGSFIKDQSDGLSTMWYDNGLLKSQASYEKGQKMGYHTEWTETGSLKERTFYYEGARMGYSELYHNGQIKEDGLYLNDKKTGVWNYYYNSSGSISKRCSYENGNYHGLATYWYNDGRLKATCCYENDKQIGYLQEWHPNGILKSEAFFFEGQYIGLYQEWNDQGQLIQSGLYLEGKRQGSWYENNHRGEYVNGQKTDLWTHQIGSVILSQKSYQNHRLQGLIQYWYPNGVLCCCGAYINDNPTGPWKYYYPNGKIGASGNYSSSTPSFSCWDPSGFYIGERLCDRTLIITFKDKETQQPDGIIIDINRSTYLEVSYETHGTRRPLAKWNWNLDEVKCEYNYL